MRTIRNLDLGGVETLLAWAAKEGWNPGVADAAPFHAADPNGFFGAFAGDTMVAGIAAVAYDDKFGFIGLYICHPDWRGQGHGKAVWDAGMAYLGPRTIGLDGVPEQQANYASMGFAKAYETVRMSGHSAGMSVPGVVEISSEHDIQALDRACFPADRAAFLRQWAAAPRRTAMLVGDGRASAYAVVRQCQIGQKIGPLFAQDETSALALLDSFGGAVQIDVPAGQSGFLRELLARDFTPGFNTARMYRGPAPKTQGAMIFGVTSLELG